MTELDSMLNALLVGVDVHWPETFTPADEKQFSLHAYEQGVAALAYRKLNQLPSATSWPDGIRSRLRELSMYQGACDAVQARRLAELLDAFATIPVHPLLFKGAALAYTHYPMSILRPRTDTDILIKATDLSTVSAVLHGLGYESNSRSNLSTKNLVSHQALFRKPDWNGHTILVDIHWKISNPVLFSDVLIYEELEERSIKIPFLGENARSIGPVDALFLACIHPTAHHYNESRLIWLYDIVLLANSLNVQQWEEFRDLAERKRMNSICSAAMEKAQECFRVKLPMHTPSLHHGRISEPAAAYLNPSPRLLNLLRLDLEKLNGWQKIQLLLQHLFPPPSFMMKKYSVSRKIVLPFLYIHRVLTGLRRWILAGPPTES